ncbi:MAG: pantoate--beta-alanine ligase, partial [Pseudomonadota bacterium]
MSVVRQIREVRARVAKWRGLGLVTAVVPTMGGLHQGHLSLVESAQRLADRVVVTIFLNPTQFGPHEDLDAYPAETERDLALLAARGVDLVFLPSREEMYPPGFATRVLTDALTDLMCGAARPGHFDGVTQVVTKLFNIVGTDMAVFGEKDWQQLQIVKKLVGDLNIPMEIVSCPTVREADGLAMSSRNARLSAEEREI